ncbi:MAG: hypothetical protein WCP55_03020 [Lentisphaerota bacterium]
MTNKSIKRYAQAALKIFETEDGAAGWLDFNSNRLTAEVNSIAEAENEIYKIIKTDE